MVLLGTPIHSLICTLGSYVIIALQHQTLLSHTHTHTTPHPTQFTDQYKCYAKICDTHRIRSTIKTADCSQVNLLSLK